MPAIKSSGIIRLLNARLAYILHILNLRLTPLAVLVFIAAGCIVILITSYIFRYSHYDYWHWKGRAATRAFCWCAALMAIKIILRSLIN